VRPEHASHGPSNEIRSGIIYYSFVNGPRPTAAAFTKIDNNGEAAIVAPVGTCRSRPDRPPKTDEWGKEQAK
jgi:hypothetical protein